MHRHILPTPAFTLIELVLSLAIASILLTGLTGAVVFATKALPAEGSVESTVLTTARQVEEFSDDLQAALWVAEHTDTAITFTVADRNGDGSPEHIRYAWGGNAGDPLTRQYNGGTVVNVLDSVQDFALTYDLKTIREVYIGAPVKSGEVSVAGYSASTDLGDAHVRKNDWWSQYFEPSIPADATTWFVTRILFMAEREKDESATTDIELRTPLEDRTPSDEVLDSTQVDQLSLPTSASWHSVLFYGEYPLSPGEGLCLAFTTKDNKSAKLRYQHDHAYAPPSALSEGKPDWRAVDETDSLLYYVYGMYYTPGPEQYLDRTYITGVRIDLQTTTDEDTSLSTGARLLNGPEILTGYWDLDFNTDPTMIDVNADSAADWLVYDGSKFDISKLNGGTWHAKLRLDTYPDDDFATPITIAASLQELTAKAVGVQLWLNADWSGSNCAPLCTQVTLADDGTQTVTVSDMRSDTKTGTLISVTGVPPEPVDLKVMIDPRPEHSESVGQRRRSRHGHLSTRSPRAVANASSTCFHRADTDIYSLSVRVGGSGGVVSP